MKTPNIETKPAHTPTPLRAERLRDNSNGRIFWLVLNSQGNFFADVTPPDESECITDADRAALIVRAVNSHAELVAALTDTLAIARIKWGNLDPDANAVMDNAAKTLASAKGTS